MSAASVGCSGAARSAQVATTPREEEPTAIALPDLLELLPQGVETLMVLKPDVLFSDPATRPVAELLLPPARRDAIERRMGIRIAELTRLIVADYGEQGFIALGAGVDRAPQVVRAIAMGMNTIETQSDAPFVRRLGYLGTQRRDVVALDAATLLFAGEAGAHVAALLTRARTGAWPSSAAPSAGGAQLADLMQQLGDAPMLVVVPHHLDLPLDTGPGLLLSRQIGLAFSIAPVAADALRVRVLIHGELPPGAHDNFRQWVLSVAGSPLGAIVGISEGLPTLRIQTEAESALVSERLPTQGLVRGMSLLLADRVGEALDVALSGSTSSQGPPSGTGRPAPAMR
ncbi:MAG: hypothetical protein GXP55_15690 [Deltaproteobacteria bacterium]|nr:hypothetical protein [Deltaproteobacteria bacterium]